MNKTSKYINLLDRSKKNENFEYDDETIQNKRPITHLLTQVNIFTLDSQINFLRNDIPGELYYDLS